MTSPPPPDTPPRAAPPTQAPTGQPWRTEVLALMALALLPRILKIASTELWLDEACSVELARQGTSALLSTLATTDASPHPPLYFVLLSWVTSLLGEGVGPVRMPSLIAGALLVGGTAEAGRRVGGRGVGRVAGLLAALAPLAVHYSVEARAYTLLAVLALGLTLTLERFLREGGQRRLAAVLALGLAAMLTHYFGLLLLPAPLILGFFHRRSPDAGRRTVAAFSALTVAALPGFWLAVGQLSRGAGGTTWLPPIESLPLAALTSLQAMGVGTRLPEYLGHAGLIRVGDWSHGLGSALVLCGLSLGAALPWLQRDLSAEARGAWRALWTLLGLTLVAPLVLSAWRPLYLPGRYELPAMAAVHVLAVAGWAGLLARARHAPVSRAFLPAVAVVIVGLSLQYLPAYLQLHTVRPFSLATMTIRRHAGPDSAVVFTHLTGPPSAWQLRQRGYRGPTHYFPASQAAHPCWLAPMARGGDAALRREGADIAAALARAGTREAWVMTALRRKRPAPPADTLFASLRAAGWAFRGSRATGHYGVARFTLRPAAPARPGPAAAASADLAAPSPRAVTPTAALGARGGGAGRAERPPGKAGADPRVVPPVRPR